MFVAHSHMRAHTRANTHACHTRRVIRSNVLDGIHTAIPHGVPVAVPLALVGCWVFHIVRVARTGTVGAFLSFIANSLLAISIRLCRRRIADIAMVETVPV